jgi:hypothetical protein
VRIAAATVGDLTQSAERRAVRAGNRPKDILARGRTHRRSISRYTALIFLDVSSDSRKRRISMRLQALHKSALLVLSGCMLFQTTGSCTSELMNSVTATVATSLSSVLVTVITDAITGALQSGTAV